MSKLAWPAVRHYLCNFFIGWDFRNFCQSQGSSIRFKKQTMLTSSCSFTEYLPCPCGVIVGRKHALICRLQMIIDTMLRMPLHHRLVLTCVFKTSRASLWPVDKKHDLIFFYITQLHLMFYLKGVFCWHACYASNTSSINRN